MEGRFERVLAAAFESHGVRLVLGLRVLRVGGDHHPVEACVHLPIDPQGAIELCNFCLVALGLIPTVARRPPHPRGITETHLDADAPFRDQWRVDSHRQRVDPRVGDCVA